MSLEYSSLDTETKELYANFISMHCRGYENLIRKIRISKICVGDFRLHLLQTINTRVILVLITVLRLLKKMTIIILLYFKQKFLQNIVVVARARIVIVLEKGFQMTSHAYV